MPTATCKQRNESLKKLTKKTHSPNYPNMDKKVKKIVIELVLRGYESFTLDSLKTTKSYKSPFVPNRCLYGLYMF